jgi:regulator of protease activity HflC (stomatin/prohibitin superfamily)
LVVSGDIFRPGVTEKDLLFEKWSSYRNTFTDDQVAIAKIEQFTKQAMKVCIGDRTFEQSTIGTTRDDLRACIDEELDAAASELGLTVRNVMVPEITLSAEAQAGWMPSCRAAC